MTRIFNEPADFADEATAGFVLSHGRWVTQVDGGVVRTRPGRLGAPVLIVGGGSGHYPAFGGLVGPGLADGAALGNIFASPATQQIVDVTLAAEAGAGVLLGFGNYAGDVINFGLAAEALREQGVDARVLAVTDDIASAPIGSESARRGLAGDIAVFKIAGGAVARGSDLDDVERVAQAANARTRTLGVAFGGCTLPGAARPLFGVTEGRMAIGLGIHGEPGIDEVEMPSSAQLAVLLVESLLADVPAGVARDGARVVALLNGLGAVKYEELFVLYADIARGLEDAGITVAEVRVGELVTSLDMAGASLTLLWLDSELEDLWFEDCDTASFSMRGRPAPSARRVGRAASEAPRDAIPTSARPESERVAELLERCAEVIDENAAALGDLDAIAGDGDHGIGMLRGCRAAAATGRQRAGAGASPGAVLDAAGRAWAAKAGGTSGAIWGAVLTALATAFDDTERPSPGDWAGAVTRAVDAVAAFGAAPGDKTMLDAAIPFGQAFRMRIDAGASFAEAWRAAAAVATRAADATADLTPRTGRAKLHALRSAGSPDAGAISFALLCRTVDEELSEGEAS